MLKNTKNCFISSIYCLFILLSIYTRSYSQPNSANRNISVPTTASIGVNWSPQVSLYSGAANVNVPLYNIQDYQYNLPINLVYNYSGLKYNDYASIVGLHWSLSVPIITRNIVDKDDFNEEKGYYFIKPADRNKEKSDMPDIFTLFCPEGTVKFFFPQGKTTGLTSEFSAEILYDNAGTFSIAYDNITKIITVSSIKGNIYTFGDFTSTKCQIKTQPKSTVPDEYFISSWHLSNIKLSNNKLITFEYTKSEKKIKSYAAQMGVVSFFDFVSNKPNVSVYSSESNMVSDETLIKNIYWTHGKITFEYDNRQDLQVEGSIAAKRLSSIQVYNKKDNLISTKKLIHDYFLNQRESYKRLQLSKILDYGNSLTATPNEYKFTYNPKKLPNYSFVQQYFGYDSLETTSGALLSIQYPNGLTTQYQYENNDYNPNAENSSLPPIKHLGARVSSISEYDRKNQMISKRRYDYRNTNGTSSGIVFCKTNNIIRQEGIYYFMTSNNWFPPIYQNELIGYGSVLEYEVLPGNEIFLNGAKRINFSNYPTQYYYDFIGAMPDYDYSNGEITSEILYKGSSKETLKQIQNKNFTRYNFSTANYNMKMFFNVPGTTGTPLETQNNIKSQRSKLLGATTLTQVLGNEQQYINESESYIYPVNNIGDYRDFFFERKTLTLGNILQKTISYKYPHNFKADRNSHPIKALFTNSNGDKTTVVEELEYNKDGSIISGTINDYTYNQISGVITPSATYKLEIDNPLPETTETSKLIPSTNNWQIHPHYNKYADYVYSNDGVLLEIKDQTNTLLTYIWGYNNLYPIAEIQNAKYSDVIEIIGQPAMQGLNVPSVTNAAINSSMTTLRSDPRMKKALITSFTYNPLQGMSSKTDPRGISESYEYDNFNRLIVVKDDSLNILKHYIYNQSNTPIVSTNYYSKAQSKIFTKNDCPPPAPPTFYEGTNVTYSVPAGKYSSSISQADADLKAVDEINRMGQEYANKNGNCSIYVEW